MASGLVRAGKEKTEVQLALDRCYAILKKTRDGMNFRDLLTAGWKEVFPDRELPQGILASLYTSLNLDARFAPQGKGKWGLAEWQPRSVRSSVPATSLLGKSYQDEHYRLASNLDDQEEELLPASVRDEELDLPIQEEDWSGDDDQG